MRTTLNMGRAATGAALAAGQNYAETTIDILRYLILPTYIAGLVLALPFGWIGDAIGWRHLGYVPGCVSFILVGYFYWVFEGRLVVGELPLEALPEWLQKHVAQWATKPGSTFKFFFSTSMVGLWFPILLWVPAEFPVWRHASHYLEALCVAMAITYLVATSESNVKYWRTKYGWIIGIFAVRHILGFMGYEVEDMWANLLSLNFGSRLPRLDSFEYLLLVVGLGIAVAILLPAFLPNKPTASTSHH